MKHTEYKAKVSTHLTHKSGEKRWVIVNSNTNEILDDNHGEGYSTESKAITKFEIKSFGSPKKIKEKINSKSIAQAKDLKEKTFSE